MGLNERVFIRREIVAGTQICRCRGKGREVHGEVTPGLGQGGVSGDKGIVKAHSALAAESN
jgi:hypothetical protein